MTKRFLRPDEVADRLDVSVRTVRFWIQRELIPHVHICGVTRIPAEELECFIAEKGHKLSRLP